MFSIIDWDKMPQLSPSAVPQNDAINYRTGVFCKDATKQASICAGMKHTRLPGSLTKPRQVAAPKLHGSRATGCLTIAAASARTLLPCLDANSGSCSHVWR